jgi:hypothetical protein
MIYLFFLFWSQVNCWKTTRLPDADLRRDCRAYEGLKEIERQGKGRKGSKDRSGNLDWWSQGSIVQDPSQPPINEDVTGIYIDSAHATR